MLSAVAWVRPHQVLVIRIGGVLMIAVGLLLLTGVWDSMTADLRQWVSNFGDNYGWGALESHWGTVQAGKTAPFVHDATNTSFCGRGYDGIWCSNP